MGRSALLNYPCTSSRMALMRARWLLVPLLSQALHAAGMRMALSRSAGGANSATAGVAVPRREPAAADVQRERPPSGAVEEPAEVGKSAKRPAAQPAARPATRQPAAQPAKATAQPAPQPKKAQQAKQTKRRPRPQGEGARRPTVEEPAPERPIEPAPVPAPAPPAEQSQSPAVAAEAEPAPPKAHRPESPPAPQHGAPAPQASQDDADGAADAAAEDSSDQAAPALGTEVPVAEVKLAPSPPPREAPRRAASSQENAGAARTRGVLHRLLHQAALQVWSWIPWMTDSPEEEEAAKESEARDNRALAMVLAPLMIAGVLALFLAGGSSTRCSTWHSRADLKQDPRFAARAGRRDLQPHEEEERQRESFHRRRSFLASNVGAEVRATANDGKPPERSGRFGVRAWVASWAKGRGAAEEEAAAPLMGPQAIGGGAGIAARASAELWAARQAYDIAEKARAWRS